MVFELCVETLAGCAAAVEGGADRVELCSALQVGGLTPSHDLTVAALSYGIPVHAMVRPRAGDFVYSTAELEAMRAEILQFKSLGVAGVVFGVMTVDGRVDVEATRELVELARPLEVTFHRAIDGAADLHAALEAVIATGCSRVLTSGGASDVHSGEATLARIVALARERIAVAAGGGLRLAKAEQLARTTRARHFHGTVTERGPVDGAVVRAMVDAIRRGAEK
jgi:copper homeostasis protein